MAFAMLERASSCSTFCVIGIAVVTTEKTTDMEFIWYRLAESSGTDSPFKSPREPLVSTRLTSEAPGIF